MDGSASSDVGGEHVHLALGRLERELAAKVPVPHASRLAAASHSSRPSIGMVQVEIARPTPVGHATCGCLPGAASPIVDGIGIGWASTSREPWRLNQRDPPRARNEDLLTERPTLAIPRLCHNASTDLLRKQQVLGSNPSVGSSDLDLKPAKSLPQLAGIYLAAMGADSADSAGRHRTGGSICAASQRGRSWSTTTRSAAPSTGCGRRTG